jgi:hypothetical protein
MALSADTPRTYAGGFDPKFVSLPCTSNVTIYEGSFVGESTTAGTYRALNGADTFVGIAHEQVINPTSGSKRVKVRTSGVVRMAVTGASAVTDNGVTVYATDDGTLSLTSTSTSSSFGKVVRWVGTANGGSGSTVCDIYFEGVTFRSI